MKKIFNTFITDVYINNINIHILKHSEMITIHFPNAENVTFNKKVLN